MTTTILEQVFKFIQIALYVAGGLEAVFAIIKFREAIAEDNPQAQKTARNQIAGAVITFAAAIAVTAFKEPILKKIEELGATSSIDYMLAYLQTTISSACIRLGIF